VFPTGEWAKLILQNPSIQKRKNHGMKKIPPNTPNNPKHGRPTTHVNIILRAMNTGEHLASIDGSYLTRRRTGGLSGIASKYMRNKESETLGLIGTGGLAYEQLLGNLKVRPIKKVFLYNRTKDKASLFQARI
ncbi:ornithine cyclodeaminase family protein, partial [Staphylococcus hyicus]